MGALEVWLCVAVESMEYAPVGGIHIESIGRWFLDGRCGEQDKEKRDIAGL